ncbi:MAG: beta-lactamase family protein [Sneathiellales bacterium]|nr:beta-lactamase family protein [Sneathiellales bacterium]
MRIFQPRRKWGIFLFDLHVTEKDLVEIDKAPEELADGWKTSTLRAQGLNPALIARLVKHIRRQDYRNIHSLLIVRKGVLVSEHYFGSYKSKATGERHAYDRATLHQTRSSFKSVTGLLTGILIEEGVFSLEDPVIKHLQRLQDFENIDPRKNKITLRHLLNMTSGMSCSEMPGAGPERETELRNNVNMVKSHGELAMVSDPGERWRYCSTNSLLLGFAMHAALGEKEEGPLKFFLDTKLMAPLDIFHYQTGRSPRGYMLMHGGQRMRPRDLAKFGQLIVANGVWKEKQIIPRSWVKTIKEKGVPTDWSWTKSILPEQQDMPPSTYMNQWFQTRMKVK